MDDKVKFNLVRSSRDRAYTGVKLLMQGDMDSFGFLLHEAWAEKKSLVKEITQDYFDTIYSKAIAAGSLGGKLLGAGGGGFFLFYVTPDRREQVIEAITNGTECRVYDFKFCLAGSRIATSC